MVNDHIMHSLPGFSQPEPASTSEHTHTHTHTSIHIHTQTLLGTDFRLRSKHLLSKAGCILLQGKLKMQNSNK